MTIIRTIPLDEATGPVAELYAEIRVLEPPRISIKSVCPGASAVRSS